jgi:hypothetical protein
MLIEYQKSCRNFIKTTGFTFSASAVTSVSGLSSFAVTLNPTALSDFPQLARSLQFTDALSNQAIIWSRAYRPAQTCHPYQRFSSLGKSILPARPGNVTAVLKDIKGDTLFRR